MEATNNLSKDDCNVRASWSAVFNNAPLEMILFACKLMQLSTLYFSFSKAEKKKKKKQNGLHVHMLMFITDMYVHAYLFLICTPFPIIVFNLSLHKHESMCNLWIHKKIKPFSFKTHLPNNMYVALFIYFLIFILLKNKTHSYHKLNVRLMSQLKKYIWLLQSKREKTNSKFDTKYSNFDS